MKNLFFLAIVIATFSCKPPHIFKNLENKKVVYISLNKYELESVPKDIGHLKDVRELYISRDSMQGWSLYPPISAIDELVDSPPFKKLPEEFLTLQKLEKLTLHGLDISRLPKDFYKLRNLEYLDLSMNKLTITNEISKLKKLKKLKYLDLVGNRVEKIQIEKWQTENPNIEIKYGEN